MSRRFLTSIRTLAGVVPIVLLVTVSAAAQAPSSTVKAPATKKWIPSRTPDGRPDLQGFWTNTTFTPLERPNNVTKEFYTREEVANIEKAGEIRCGTQGPNCPEREPGTTSDVHYDDTQFALDRNQTTYASNLRTSLIVDPANGKVPPFTAEGQKRAAERAEVRRRMGGPNDAVQNMPIGSRCIIMAGSGPPMLFAGYNSNYQIVQTPGYVMILVEMIHDVRIIPLDGRPHVPQGVRQWMGDSRGRWEGDTLVVETTNFNDKNSFRGASENMRVIERFTRVDADTIQYKFTIEDETTWARPWSAELPMKKTVGPIFEHACHEGNYGVANTLAGARAEEKRAAQEAAKKGSQ